MVVIKRKSRLAPVSGSTRIKIVHDYLHKHRRKSTIAREYHINPKTVKNLIDKFRRTTSVDSISTASRHTIIPNQTLDNYIEQHPRQLAKSIARHFKKNHNLTVSTRTIQRQRRAIGYTPHPTSIALAKTPSQQRSVHDWAILYKKLFGLHWLFQDESTVVIQRNGQITWAKPGQKIPKRVVKIQRAAVQIWGVVWWRGKIITRQTGYINQFKYMEWLDREVAPMLRRKRGSTFVQDQHGSHWTKAVQKWFEHIGIQLVKLPVKTPDFNPIENCWAWIKDRVEELEPIDQITLESAVDTAIKDLPVRVIREQIRHSKHCVIELAES